MPLSSFASQVRQAFGRRVASYESQGRLQRGIAWRLGGVAHHHGWPQPDRGGLPPGPCADLGAGTGLVGRALKSWQVALPEPLLQLDLCSEALARNTSGPTLPWDLNQGLPPHLKGAALLISSFALQWLEAPSGAIAHWGEQLAPGGWLLLAVPTAGSFPEWRQAARQAAVPCGALALPEPAVLRQAAASAGLMPILSQVLSHPPATGGARGPLKALRALQAIGADTSRHPPLSPGAWRRLLAAWPPGERLSWEVLVLLARKTESPRPPGAP